MKSNETKTNACARTLYNEQELYIIIILIIVI